MDEVLKNLIAVGERMLADEREFQAREVEKQQQLQAATKSRAMSIVRDALSLSDEELAAFTPTFDDDSDWHGFCVVLHAYGETLYVELIGVEDEHSMVRVKLMPNHVRHMWNDLPVERASVSLWLARAWENERRRKEIRGLRERAPFKRFVYYKVWWSDEDDAFYEVRSHAGQEKDAFITVGGQRVWVPHVVRIEEVEVDAPEDIPMHWYGCWEVIAGVYGNVTVHKMPEWA